MRPVPGTRFMIFGDGHNYDWALADDNEVAMDEDAQKLETK